ncbi:hypothetical protein [Mycolicibacter icosiumassiliensis]|uniref:hypothetical protein n=1 Tax=Mycolicibacter icosiumassiliensis TaxID=1792835 RepID=UPI000ACE6F10|nr:hypothetical protein [Mycolicibacter icosiumassiliensis]
MTDTVVPTPAAPAPPTWTRWLYRALAMTGLAVGIFVIAAGTYLLFFAHPGCCKFVAQPATTSQAKDDCCAAMKKDDNGCCATMKERMKNMPSMSPMPSMHPMPGMPTPSR